MSAIIGVVMAVLLGLVWMIFLPSFPQRFYLQEGTSRWRVKTLEEEVNSIGQFVFPGDTCQIDVPGELTIWPSEKPMLEGRFRAEYMSRESMDPPLCPSNINFIIPREFFEKWRKKEEENDARLQEYLAKARERAVERWAEDPDRKRY